MQIAPTTFNGSTNAPIGVFDSGLGGISVLRALRAELPGEDFIYVADSGFAPYGERGDAFVLNRSMRITEALLAIGVKAIVVACNTATLAAISSLRTRWPTLPVIGVEPALKPAALSTKTGHVGVLATRGTLQSARFLQLISQFESTIQFHCQPCDGLVKAIESFDRLGIEALGRQYVGKCITATLKECEIDTLVLGCTHYPLIKDQICGWTGDRIRLLDTGAPVARQTRRLLESQRTLQISGKAGSIRWHTTGDLSHLSLAVQHYLPTEKFGAPTLQPLQI
jgi:glutamate racemase